MYQTFLFVFLASLNSTFGNILLKLSREHAEEGSSILSQYMSWSFFGAIIFYALNVFLFAKALDNLPVNVGYPILASSSFAMLALASWLILGEKHTFTQMSGLLLIIGGIIMISLGASK